MAEEIRDDLEDILLSGTPKDLDRFLKTHPIKAETLNEMRFQSGEKVGYFAARYCSEYEYSVDLTRQRKMISVLLKYGLNLNDPSDIPPISVISVENLEWLVSKGAKLNYRFYGNDLKRITPIGLAGVCAKKEEKPTPEDIARYELMKKIKSRQQAYRQTRLVLLQKQGKEK